MSYTAVAAFQMDPASIFVYVLLAIAAYVVWWGHRQSQKDAEARREEETGESEDRSPSSSSRLDQSEEGNEVDE